MLYKFTITAPSAGDDLLQGKAEFSSSKSPRIIKKIGCSGGTAAGDSQVRIFVGGELVSDVDNTITGDVIIKQEDMLSCGTIPVSAGKKIEAILEVDGGNNISLAFETVP